MKKIYIMEIHEEIIYSIGDSFLNSNEIGKMLVVNKKFKKIFIKLYTGYIGNVIFKITQGDSLYKSREMIEEMEECIKFVSSPITKKKESFINFIGIILYSCNIFCKRKKKRIQFIMKYRSNLELGLLNRIRFCPLFEIEKIKKKKLFFRHCEQNIYLKSSLINEKTKNNLLRKKFKSVYAILIH
jgi:hypothetical protein